MNQLVTHTPHTELKSLKNKLFAPLRHAVLAVLLLCSAWVAWAGNLTVKVGSETLAGKASLEEALSGKTLANITSIEITAGEFTTDDWNYLLSKRGELSGLAEFTITSGITSVADSPTRTGDPVVAYFGDAIKKVVIHKIEKIGNRTFYKLPNLTTVSLPDATSIGAGAFRECTSLGSVSLPKVDTIKGGSNFLGCIALTSISLPVVELFAIGAFNGCKNLALIQLGATPPTATATNIFLNLPSTRYLVLVNANGTPLVGDELSAARAQYNLTDNKWNGWTIIEPSITVKVNDTIAQTATSLEEAIAAAGVELGNITSIEVNAGAFMTADWEYLKSKKSNLSALTSLVITKGVSMVADLPDAETDYGEYIPRNIERVVIHKLKRVGKCGFDSCKKLVEAELPDAKFLGQYAFWGCSVLKKVYLPVVSAIGRYSFDGCVGIAQLKLGTTVPSVGENAFRNTAATRYLVLVNASGTSLTGTTLTNAKNAYMADAGWNATTQKWHGWSFDWKLRLSVNGNDIVGASLEHALASSGIALGDITSIVISAGEFVAADWEYLKANRTTISKLEKFTITNGISSVADIPNTYGNGCFGDAIKEVQINKVKVIGVSAFDKSPNLTKVSLPDATTLSQWAFFECLKLESVSIPAVTTIGFSAFYRCKSLSRLLLLKTTDIGSQAFNGCAALTELWLGITPPTVVNDVFANGPAKRYLRPMVNSSTPADATAIANYKAIDDGNTADNKWYGWELDWVALSVNGADAVRDTSLQAAIEASGVELGEITSLSIEQGNIVTADWTYLYSKKTLLNQLSEFTINSGVGDVSNSMYGRQRIGTPPRVRYVYYSVFGSSLRSFTAKRGLNEIPQSAFSGCSNLTMVDVPNLDGKVQASAFNNCTKLVSIDLKKATQVSANAFSGDTMLCSVKCPAVTSIGDNAFKNCKSLTHIALGATPPTVNNANAFEGTATTRYIELLDANGTLTGTQLDNAQTQYKNVNDGNTTDSYWYGWAIERHIQIKINGGNEQNGSSLEAAIGSFTLSSITSIEVVGGAFMTADWEYLKSKQSNLSALTSLVITNGVSMVADLPDAGGNTGVYIPRSIQRVVIHKLKRVGKCGFDACSKLVEAELPDAVELGQWAFWGCSALKKVYLPVVSTIGPESFTRCSTLTSVNLPKLTSIAASAFSECFTLVQLQLGTAVPSVGPDAFEECPSPRYLVLVDADGKPLVGDARTTAQESYKASLGWNATEEKWHGWGFASISLKVNGGEEHTDATLEDAIAAAGIELGEITSIEVTAGAFMTADWEYLLAQKDQLNALEHFVVTDGAEYVAASPDIENVKQGYFGAALKEVSIAKLQVLGVNTFDRGPKNLTTVNLPDVKEVRGDAFYGCKALTNISLPKATNLGDNVFASCSTLVQLQLGTAVPSVGDEAFKNCPSPRYLVLVDADGKPLMGDELTTAQETYKADAGWDATEEKWHGWSFATPRIISIVSKNGQVLLEQGVPAGENQYAVVAELNPTISFTMKANSGYSGGSAVVFETGNEANKITTTKTNETYSFEMPAHDVTIRATFSSLYTIKVQANPVAGGTVTGGGNYSSGSSVVVWATPSSGYRFVRWTENGVEKSTEAVYTFNASSSCTLVAEFEKESSEDGETGLYDAKLEALSVYPNPTAGAVQVEATGEVFVSNVAGQLLQRVHSQGKVLIDLSAYPNGVYIIRVGNAVAKVVKQ